MPLSGSRSQSLADLFLGSICRTGRSAQGSERPLMDGELAMSVHNLAPDVFGTGGQLSSPRNQTAQILLSSVLTLAGTARLLRAIRPVSKTSWLAKGVSSSSRRRT